MSEALCLIPVASEFKPFCTAGDKMQPSALRSNMAAANMKNGRPCERTTGVFKPSITSRRCAADVDARMRSRQEDAQSGVASSAKHVQPHGNPVPPPDAKRKLMPKTSVIEARLRVERPSSKDCSRHRYLGIKAWRDVGAEKISTYQVRCRHPNHVGGRGNEFRYIPCRGSH